MHSILRTLNNGLCEMTCSIPIIVENWMLDQNKLNNKYTVYSSKISVGSQNDEYEYVHNAENSGKIYNRCLIIDRHSAEKVGIFNFFRHF